MSEPKTIQRALLDGLERRPDEPAVGFAELSGRVEWMTTSELHRQAAARIEGLRRDGVEAGGRAVLVTSSPRYAALTVTGILQLGGVPLLVAPPAIQGVNSQLQQVIEHVLGLTGGVLVGEHEEGTAAEGDVSIVEPDPSATAALQLTSGTTGFPRVCVWRHAQVLTAISGMSDGMHLTDDDVYANWTPLYHDMGLVNNFLLCLIRGIPLVLIDPLDFIRRPVLWLSVIHEHRATQTWAPNFGYAIAAQRIRDEEMEGIRLDHMRGFWNAGEKVHIGTFEEFYDRFEKWGLRWKSLKANFGCAENVGGATFTDPDGELIVERVQSDEMHEQRRAVVADDSFTGATERTVSTGKGHPLLDVHILDDDGSVLGDGMVGQIALETPSRLIEFMGQPEENAKTIQGPYLLTGDLGYLRDGELFWIGRLRERINLAGVKYDPSDLELVVNEVDGLRKGCFAAFGVEDPRLGTQRLVVVCEVVGAEDLPLAKIAAQVRQQATMRLGVTVSEVALVPKGTLTKTSSGKRRHLHFRDMYVSGELEVLHREGDVKPK
jgi:acyl-CoA synthetase (AMP-forming)/AMP-acid ligase II